MAPPEHVARQPEAWVAPAWRLRGVRGVFGLTSDGPTGIVGPSKMFGAITQRIHGLLPFIHEDLHLFSPCGTMFPLIFSLQETWQNNTCWIRSLLKIAR